MAYVETIGVSLAMIFIMRWIILDLPQQIFGRNSLIGWACNHVQRGCYVILITPANMFWDGAKEIRRSVQRHPWWQQLGALSFALLLWLAWLTLWLPAKMIGRPSGKKK